MPKKNRPVLIFRDFMMVEGKKVELDLQKTDLADRCKLALAEMLSGQTYEFERSGS